MLYFTEILALFGGVITALYCWIPWIADPLLGTVSHAFGISVLLF